ncbi:MAG: hypothetical protein ACYCVH_08765 [Ignavibacteriaceae bacterium]
MKLFFPKNIFTGLIKDALPTELRGQISFLPSSLIAGETAKDPNSIGLIPTLDLIRQKDFFISKLFGISFESSLCNSYIYFNSNKKNINELFISGDVSSLEVILAKILFEEMYETAVEVKISADISKLTNQNILLVGDKNFEDEKFIQGISFAEEIVDAFSFPFVNYVFASSSNQLIEELNKHLSGVSSLIYDKIENGNFGEKLSQKAIDYTKDNFSSFIFDLNDQDMDGINQLIQLPFLRGIVNEITEVKFV